MVVFRLIFESGLWAKSLSWELGLQRKWFIFHTKAKKNIYSISVVFYWLTVSKSKNSSVDRVFNCLNICIYWSVHFGKIISTYHYWMIFEKDMSNNSLKCLLNSSFLPNDINRKPNTWKGISRRNALNTNWNSQDIWIPAFHNPIKICPSHIF